MLAELTAFQSGFVSATVIYLAFGALFAAIGWAMKKTLMIKDMRDDIRFLKGREQMMATHNHDGEYEKLEEKE